MSERGRPKKIESPERMLELFEQYKTECKANPILKHVFVGKDGDSAEEKRERPLSFEGFQVFIYKQIGMLSLDQYFTNQNECYHDFVEVCRAIKIEIRQDQIDGGMAGIYNPSITQRLNGLVEKTQAEVKADVKVEDVTIKIFDSKEEKK